MSCDSYTLTPHHLKSDHEGPTDPVGTVFQQNTVFWSQLHRHAGKIRPHLDPEIYFNEIFVARSTPEFILVYIFLQLWEPSMLPAIVALALHNGAIIGHLLGRYSDEIRLRPDSSSGLNRYAFEIVPRMYGQFLAFLFYRWEIIMRETAILGVLGIATLGFYIDSAIDDIRLDRVMVLILVTAILNLAIDSLSRHIRSRLRLTTRVESCRT